MSLITIRLEPLGAELKVKAGTSLETALFDYGVEFPCGGTGTCGGCKVRVLQGQLPVTPRDREQIDERDLSSGWRLACEIRPTAPLTLYVAQWDTPILADFEHTKGGARTGLGIAIDLGTTTIVGQLVNLSTGAVLGVRTLLNPQSAYGADVMSRVDLAMRDDRLTHLIRGTIASMVEDLAANQTIDDVVVVGNTVMHHILAGVDVTPLSYVPFRSPHLDAKTVRHGRVTARVLRCLGGFVGSDILAGIVATGIHRRPELSALIDLGTNGEIVVGNRERLLCASTAAGPAFEAGRIGCGMRASTGAISHVSVENGGMRCRVIGAGEARGICGSGLVDAAAAGLQLGDIHPSGRLAGGPLRLDGDVTLKQSDIRELQLAKGATASGLTILLDRLGAKPQDLCVLYLAGAFGNYVDTHSAARIGLIPVDPSRVKPSGNTALRGARMLLLDPGADSGLNVEHVELAADTDFQQRFTEALAFPAAAALAIGRCRPSPSR